MTIVKTATPPPTRASGRENARARRRRGGMRGRRLRFRAPPPATTARRADERMIREDCVDNSRLIAIAKKKTKIVLDEFRSRQRPRLTIAS